MNRRIVLSPDAWADLDSAARWYDRIERNLSRRFRAEVDKTLYVLQDILTRLSEFVILLDAY